MQRTIRFTRTAASTVYGSFGEGDVARFPEDVARHFVEDAQAAVYADAAPPAPAPAEPAPVPAPRKRTRNPS